MTQVVITKIVVAVHGPSPDLRNVTLYFHEKLDPNKAHTLTINVVEYDIVGAEILTALSDDNWEAV